MLKTVASYAILGIILLSGAGIAQVKSNVFAPKKPGRDFTLYKESGADIMARFQWYTEMRTGEDGIPSAHDRIRAWQQSRTMKVYQPNVLSKTGGTAEAVWTNVGPVNQGGRLTGIAIDPTNADIVYIGAAAGGVWKSTNGGGDFVPISDDLPTLAVGALTVDPSNPSTIWLGTGEANGNLDSYPGVGIFKSTNAGQTWEITGFQDDTRVSMMEVHPTISDIVVATTLAGIKRTEDCGETWRTVRGGVVYDLEVDPIDPSRWYAGVRGKGVVRSLDTGRTWQDISDVWEDSLGLKLGNIQRLAIGLCRTQPEIMYAVLVQYSGSSLYAIMKTTDGGDSWEKLPTPGTNFFSAQGFYNCVLAVDPEDPDRLFVGGVRLYMSENGGEGWTTRSVSHVDQHAYEFSLSDPDVCYIGHDGGVDRSDNAGRTYTNVNGELPITQFYDFAVSYQDPRIMLGGAQDNGTRYSTSDSPIWTSATGGDGTYCVIDYSDKNYMYSKMQYGQSRWRTTNGGERWVRIMSGLEHDGPWVTPTVIDPQDPATLYTVTNYDFYKTTNRGVQWVKLAPRATTSGTMRVIAVSPVNTNHIATGYSGTGGVALSVDGGVTWKRVAASFPRTTVTDIEYHPTDLNTIYATFSGNRSNTIFKTTDGGESWDNISGDLPEIQKNTIVLDPGDDNVLYVGTDFGVYVTYNGGENWFVLGTGMPKAPVIDMELHVPTGLLRAATHGRSIYELTVTTSVDFETFTATLNGNAAMLKWSALASRNLNGFAVERKAAEQDPWKEIGYVQSTGTGSGLNYYSYTDAALPVAAAGVYYRLRQISADGSNEYSREVLLSIGDASANDYVLSQNYPNPFNPLTTIRYSLPESGDVRLVVTDEKGLEVATLVNGHKSPGSYNVQFDASDVTSGVYFYHLITGGKKITRKMVVLK